MRYKESAYKYAVYRKNRTTDGFSLHSKHMTKSAAEEKRSNVKKRFGKGYVKKL